jgi:hypothetical protein
MGEEINEDKLRKVRNLRMFKGKSDEEIREFFRNREPRPDIEMEIPAESVSEDDVDAKYEKQFKSKLKALQGEYGVDMNSSNDMELLKTLVRSLIQHETVNNQIVRLQSGDEIDTKTLKNLGDYQRTLIQSITEIQQKLGISRDQRKAKQTDDVGIFMTDLKKRAKAYFDKSTTQVHCTRCGVELVRYWLNFPEHVETVHFEATCWKCGEKLIYTT